MTELKDEHMQVIDENKAKAYQEKKDMRKELTELNNEWKTLNKRSIKS